MLTRTVIAIALTGTLGGCAGINVGGGDSLASASPTVRTSATPSAAVQLANTTPDTMTPSERCTGINEPKMFRLPSGTTLAAAFDTSADRITSWRMELASAVGVQVENTSPSPSASPGRDLQGGADWTVCYFDGDFGPVRGDEQDTKPHASRLVVVIDETGLPDIAAIGYAKSLPLIDPNQGGQPKQDAMVRLAGLASSDAQTGAGAIGATMRSVR